MSKRLLLALVFSALMLSTPVLMKRMTHGFRLSKLRLEASFRPDWEMAPLSKEKQEEVEKILAQPFSYLDRGAQCYVFLSRDGEYVLKLFRYDQPLNPLRRLFRKAFAHSKVKTPFAEKIEKFFSACMLAYHSAKEETGLVYLHLNPMTRRLPLLRIRAPLGKKYKIPLDCYRFALQRRAVTMRDAFFDAYRKNDPERVKAQLHSLIELVKSRSCKGICNSDPALSRNFGFIGEQAIELDFGSYAFLQTGSSKEELRLFFERLERWFCVSFPRWARLIEEERQML